jgi:hypothetical protein
LIAIGDGFVTTNRRRGLSPCKAVKCSNPSLAEHSQFSQCASRRFGRGRATDATWDEEGHPGMTSRSILHLIPQVAYKTATPLHGPRRTLPQLLIITRAQLAAARCSDQDDRPPETPTTDITAIDPCSSRVATTDDGSHRMQPPPLRRCS